MMMQCGSISLPWRQSMGLSRRPREMRRTFFRRLFGHLHAGVAVILAMVIIVIYGWTQRIQGQTEICTEVMAAVW